MLQELCHLDQCQFHQQALVGCGAVVDVTIVAQFQRGIKEARCTTCRLFGIARPYTLRHLEERERLRVAAHQQVAEVPRQTTDEMPRLETFAQHPVEREHHLRNIHGQDAVGYIEIVIIVQHIEVLNRLGVGDVAVRERSHLIEDRKRIAHTAVGFSRDDIERLLFIFYPLALRHVLEVRHRFGHFHAVEVIDLTTRQDGGQNLVFLGRSQDKDGMRGRLLERFEKRVEGRLREHVHLVDDEHLIAPHLRRDLHLLDEFANIVDRVVRRRVQFMNVVRASFVERHTTFAAVTSLPRRSGRKAVDCLGKNARRSRFTHPTRAAKQIGVRQFSAGNGVFECSGQGLLSHHRVETRGAIFAGRNNVV